MGLRILNLMPLIFVLAGSPSAFSDAYENSTALAETQCAQRLSALLVTRLGLPAGTAVAQTSETGPDNGGVFGEYQIGEWQCRIAITGPFAGNHASYGISCMNGNTGASRHFSKAYVNRSGNCF